MKGLVHRKPSTHGPRGTLLRRPPTPLSPKSTPSLRLGLGLWTPPQPELLQSQVRSHLPLATGPATGAPLLLLKGGTCQLPDL